MLQVQKLVAKSILDLPWKDCNAAQLSPSFVHKSLLHVFSVPSISKGMVPRPFLDLLAQSKLSLVKAPAFHATADECFG